MVIVNRLHANRPVVTRALFVWLYWLNGTRGVSHGKWPPIPINFPPTCKELKYPNVAVTSETHVARDMHSTGTQTSDAMQKSQRISWIRLNSSEHSRTAPRLTQKQTYRSGAAPDAGNKPSRQTVNAQTIFNVYLNLENCVFRATKCISVKPKRTAAARFKTLKP